jgi:hypothetical protein
MKLAFAWWTREMVAHFIKDKFKITLRLFLVGRLLRSWASPARTLCIAPWSATRNNPGIAPSSRAWRNTGYRDGLILCSNTAAALPPAGVNLAIEMSASAWSGRF